MAKWKITKRCFYGRPKKDKKDKYIPNHKIYAEGEIYESEVEDENVPHYFEPIDKEAKEIAKKFEAERKEAKDKFKTKDQKLTDTLEALKRREKEAREATEQNAVLMAKVSELESKINKKEKKSSPKK